MTRRPVFQILLATALFAPLVGCEAQKSDNPLSPAIAGPIAGVEISTPRVLEPGEGLKLKESQQPITLLVENSSSNGVRPVAYTFEVSSTQNFEQKLYARSGVTSGPDGRTRVTVDRLDSGRRYFWRVKADDGANASGYSTATFEVLPKPQLNPPVQRSPIENAQVATRRPELLVSTAERNAAVGTLVYEFQISNDVPFSGIVSAGERPETGSVISYTPDNDLAASATYYWRARATDRETTSAWSNPQPFRTSAAPAPGPAPSPSPGPGTGGSCASNNGPAIAKCIAAKYPEKLVAGVSLGQRQDNMSFIRDRMIEAGKCGGMDLGRNLKRGGPELSIDFLVWRTGGESLGIDIGFDYDNTSTPLVLTWAVVGPGAFYTPGPSAPCN